MIWFDVFDFSCLREWDEISQMIFFIILNVKKYTSKIC